MQTIKDSDLRLFEKIVQMKQPILLKTMTTYLQKYYKKVVMTRDYVFAEGELPVIIMAHLDTVFKQPPQNIYYDSRKGVIWSPEGLGADDRAGVFAILKILEAGYRPHIIFTTEEEIGGLGADNLRKVEKVIPFKELKYIIELDRQGTNDCVFYGCDNIPFIDYVESFGFTEAIGSFSDISILCPSWGIAGVNLSIGYINEHSIAETLHINPLFATIKKVMQMLDDAFYCEKFEYIASKTKNINNWWDYPLDSLFNFGYGNQITCSVCGNSFDEYETFPVKALDGTLKNYCGNCIINKVEWCEDCHEAFEINPKVALDSPVNRLCKDCFNKKYFLKNKVGKNNGKGRGC